MRSASFLAFGLAIACVHTVSLHAAQGTAVLGVSAVVPDSVKVQFENVFDQLHLGDANSSNGQLDVPGAFQLMVKSAGSSRRVLNVTIEVEPNIDLLQAMDLNTRSEFIATKVSAAAGTGHLSNIMLGYQLKLSDKTKDGSFLVPVTLTINL
jgi:hypothetical protein